MNLCAELLFDTSDDGRGEHNVANRGKSNEENFQQGIILKYAKARIILKVKRLRALACYVVASLISN
jgi:hypothetical protein